ncbi:MAG: adenylate kinase [Propionibacteriaceae bacterium]|jgi:adenylate kinase|nr:adenylate kinase [Propionibacteriaceae bacterium]
MRMLIMGPPGAGKGTQGVVIAEHFGIPAISTGAIFRSNVAEQTELGKVVSEIMNRGELVPDDVTTQLVADRLAQPDAAQGFLLDGFPRTVPQAKSLDEILDKLGTPLDAVLSLVVSDEVLVARMMKRAEIEHREDDNEETIRNRFKVYADETEPLLALYRDRGLLVEVDGLGEVAEVNDRIVAALEKKSA